MPRRAADAAEAMAACASVVKLACGYRVSAPLVFKDRRMTPNYWQRVNFDAKIFTPQKIAVMAEVLAEEGIPTSKLLQGSGCSETSLVKPSTRVSYRQLKAVYANACRLSTRPGIALHIGMRVHLTSMGLYGYAMLSSATLRQSLELAVKYLPVGGPACTYEVAIGEDEVTWTCEPVLAHDPDEDMYRFCVELHLATIHTLCIDLLGADFKPKRLHLAYPRPSHARQYQKLLRCPTQFGQSLNQLVSDARWLDRPLVLRNEFGHAMFREMCDGVLLQARPTHGIAGRLREALILHPGRFAAIENVAHELGVSARTLRRWLEAEQTTYQQIVADVRRQLAVSYLGQTQLTNEEIAERLGYSDAANFRHAFKRWTGKNPGEYRAIQRQSR